MPWGRRLKAPIALLDGRKIRTLADARAVMRTLPATVQQNEYRLFTTELLMSAAEGKWGTLEAATEQLRETLRAEQLLSNRESNDRGHDSVREEVQAGVK